MPSSADSLEFSCFLGAMRVDRMGSNLPYPPWLLTHSLCVFIYLLGRPKKFEIDYQRS